mmetsp:Transcript_28712/g.73665  ORF Transcript_28712/g.73665 Transcript_28712/m.73665 type:complete len:349 (-) Transcript_28712:150-1196(-)
MATAVVVGSGLASGAGVVCAAGCCWSHACIPGSIRRPWQVFAEEEDTDVAFENSAPHATAVEHEALLQVARATFDLLSVAEKEVYEDVSLMELTAFLSWLLSQARGRGCPQEVLVDLTRRTGLWAEVECAWDGLTDDEKGSWVPADARSFLQQTGLGTALGVLGAQQVDAGARDEVGTGSLRHKRCRLRSKMSRPAWAAGAAESRPLLDSATAAVPCASASEAEQHDLGGEAGALPLLVLRLSASCPFSGHVPNCAGREDKSAALQGAKLLAVEATGPLGGPGRGRCGRGEVRWSAVWREANHFGDVGSSSGRFVTIAHGFADGSPEFHKACEATHLRDVEASTNEQT